MSIFINLSADILRNVGNDWVTCIITVDNINYPAEIKIRGNSSATVPKKGYNINFKYPVNLFGFGSYINWSIIGEFFDCTYIRSQLIYKLGEEMGILSPPFKNIALKTLELKGYFFYGLYSITRKYKTEDIPGNPDVIVQFDRPDESDNLFPPQVGAGSTALIDDYNKIKFSKKEIREKCGPLYENFKIKNADYPSFIKNFIINEFSSNHDAHIYSSYSYVLPDTDKIISGFLWDFNFSFGNILDVYTEFNPNSRFWSARQSHRTDVFKYFNNFKFACSTRILAPTYVDNYIHDNKMYIAKTRTNPNFISFSINCTEFKSVTAWYMKLLKDEKFVCQMTSKYEKLRDSVLSKRNICYLINQFSEESFDLAIRDIKNWYSHSTSNITNVADPIGNPEEFYNQSVKYLSNWANDRLDWLDDHIMDPITETKSLNNWDGYWKKYNTINRTYPYNSAPYKI